MSYSVDFEKKTLKVIAKWKRSNPSLYKKFKALLSDMLEHPGVPGDRSGTYRLNSVFAKVKGTNILNG